MSILLFGHNGQLGTLLYEQLIDTDVFPSDVSNQTGLKQWFIEKSSYAVIINAAAMTTVDGCENNE